jgi:hypothetical protein
MPTTFTIDEKDYRAALQLHQRPLRFWRWAANALLLLAVVLFFARSAGGNWEFFTYLICPALVVSGLLLLLLRAILPSKVTRSFRQMKELQGPQTVEVMADGLHGATALGTITRPWSYFHHWIEDDRLFLLYLNELQFIVLPKRAFTDPAVLAALRQHLAAQPRPRYTGPLLSRLTLMVFVVAIFIVNLILAAQLLGPLPFFNPFSKTDPRGAVAAPFVG